MSADSGTPPIANADLTAWLAVAAGTMGALMATLDISIVNAAIPTIQGEIGASGSEGTWISTAYLVAEIIAIPLTGWLERVFGLRTFLLAANIAFIAFSIMCGLSTTLTMMIIGRTGQGFFGGTLIPTAMTIIATRLPQHQQATGIAMTGSVMVLGPIMGPLLGGWMTENVSWHYAFFLNLPVGILMLGLIAAGLRSEPIRLHLLRGADWLGIAGLALGLGCLTIVLEEGQREQWYASPLVGRQTIVSAVGFVLLIAGQFIARAPVIKLSLLLRRSFGAVFLTSLALGSILYGIAYLIPQYLSRVAGYNAFQSGQIVLLAGVPMLFVMPFIPWLFKNLDVRIAVGLGLFLMGLGCYVDADLTSRAAGESFYMGQVLRGFGQVLMLLFLNQAALDSVDPRDAADASALFNGGRNLGGSFSLALASTMTETRTWLHERRLEEGLSRTSQDLQTFVRNAGQQLGQGDIALGMRRAIGVLERQVMQQATVMTFNDLFLTFAMITFALVPLCLLLSPLRDTGKPAAMH